MYPRQHTNPKKYLYSTSNLVIAEGFSPLLHDREGSIVSKCNKTEKALNKGNFTKVFICKFWDLISVQIWQALISQNIIAESLLCFKVDIPVSMLLLVVYSIVLADIVLDHLFFLFLFSLFILYLNWSLNYL